MGFAENIASKLMNKVGHKAVDKIKEHHDNAQHHFTKNVTCSNIEDKNAELPPLKIQIYTHNIRQETKNLADGEKPWSIRKEGVIRSILKTTENIPTLVGLQEVKQNQLNDILDKLGSHWSFFGVGRTDGKSKGEFSPILYKKDEWELLSGKTYWLSETPDHPSKGWDAAYERIVTVVIMKHKKLGKIVNYLNTHYDHKGKKARENSSKEIVGIMNKCKGTSFLSGDFNSEPKAEAYKTLSQYLLDTACHCQEKDGFLNTITDFRGNGNSSIDFIWVPKGVKVLKHEILSHEYNGYLISDHRPVVCEFEI
ncbi:uncharacterized protein PRCAT00005256001 [Priceomyces carsonii]|uniref:uncharacterized protein n=1 Tax=Priceomyces carsonii TaxID=28549 RepID=UPI002EDA97D8|nr:unnamed protein product [Priceomyces carsonii]